jgi:hypothetical protein
MTGEKRKRSGVILALVGVGLPLVLFPFADYYHADRAQDRMLFAYPDPCFPIPAEYFEVPYGYIFALGVVLFFGGLGLLILGYMYEEKKGVS